MNLVRRVDGKEEIRRHNKKRKVFFFFFELANREKK